MERRSQRSEATLSQRIEVAADETISSQARRYAEFRVFAALTQSARIRNARSARVVLRQLKPDGQCSGVACTVTVSLEAGTVRIRASGAHAYAAINRAVERIRS
jgi:ribosome-associated translation inhibitor RaiA